MKMPCDEVIRFCRPAVMAVLLIAGFHLAAAPWVDAQEADTGAESSSTGQMADKPVDLADFVFDPDARPPAPEAGSLKPLDEEEAPAVQMAEARKQVKAVEIKGNNTIALAKILTKIKTRVGQEYRQSVISDDLKRLYNTGFFSDVSVDREPYADGYRVIFYVTEKPIIGDITFSKLKFFRPAALLRKIQTKKGKFFDSKTLKDDIRVIEELYAKKGLTQVEVSVETDMDELTNKANLHFIISEGKRVQIDDINFLGNITFTDKQLLKVVKSRRDGLFNSGFLQEDVLDEDIQRLESYYEKEGFIDARAKYTLDPLAGEDGRLLVTFQIEEGQRYYVDDVTFTGNVIADDWEIRLVMKETQEGQVFSRERLSVDLSNIRTLYFDKGYIFADVKESTSLDPETGRVDVRLDITEGELAYINRITVQGNERTRDIVVRREMRLYPGDRFDGEKLRRSKQRLNNLGYFEDISYDVKDTDSPNRKDLVVQVKEAKTGSLSFGGGYSTVDQIVGFVEVEQRNFDFTNWPTFTGGGQQLSLRAENGSTRTNTRLSFTEPWLFDYPVSGGFDLYLSERQREEDVGYAYDEKRVGGALRLGKQFTEYLTGNTSYRWEKVDVGNFQDDVSADLLAEEGENVVSSVSFGLTHEGRDNAFSPTKGLYVSGSTEIAGGLFGGDKDFVRFSQQVSYNIPFKYDSVVEFRLRSGIIDAYGDSERVPIFERFFAGGSRTIRGYDERKVGPLDTLTEDPIGGEALLVGNIEYTIPVIEFIKLAVFYDIGNVWSRLQDYGSGGFKSGTGLGLRVKTPIGPVNLDYGYPLNDEPGEDSRSGKFYFSVSRGF